MSRIGKLPVAIPKGVKVRVEGALVEITGPKGTLRHALDSGIGAKVDEGSVSVTCEGSDQRPMRALWGLTRSLISNMVVGVTQGYVKDLEVLGVGYRAEIKGKELVLSVGYSHPVHIPVPEGISITVEKNNVVRVTGIDKQRVGEIAAEIRAVKVPDPYKVKGIKYAGEQIRRKVGKAGA